MDNLLRKAREFYNDKNPNDELTQAELGRRVGVTRQTIQKIEGGKIKPNVFLAIQLARTLKVRRVDSIFVVPR